MDLASKFKDAANCVLIRIEQMIQNENYTIVRVAKTPSGHVIFYIRKVHDAVKLYKIFLPLQYADVVSDKDMNEINNDKIWLTLVYKGENKNRFPVLEIT